MFDEVLAECSDLIRAKKKMQSGVVPLKLKHSQTPGINDRNHISFNDNLYFLPRQPK